MEVSFEHIKFIKGVIENFPVSEEIPQVDVIVSEWMGYFLLFENMVSSYILSI
jgi:protein arginine N-methyltransferase 3